MKKRLGSILIVIGALLLLGALGIAGYNMFDSRRAEMRAEEAEVKLIERIERNRSEKKVLPPMPGQQPFVEEMPVEEIDGHGYIGSIEIPALDKKLPVLEEWNYDNLQISACRYSGSYYTDDLVICAHNYSSHFYGLLSIQPGEEVIFTTVDGVQYRYVITACETLYPTEVEKLVENKEDCDLTLFTCNLGGWSRCVIRCARI